MAQNEVREEGGIDDVTVELVRFGSTELQNAVFQVVIDMWTEAATANEGHEADTWSKDSKTGVRIPMFKNKGSRSDKKLTIAIWPRFLSQLSLSRALRPPG